MMTELIKLTQETDNSNGTWLQGTLPGCTYAQLIKAFGEPTYTDGSGDDKVQFEWVFKFNESIFTIYDWKTYNRDHTMNKLTTWNIGGHTECGAFINYIKTKLNK